jgi:hypothetical protein
MQAQRVPAESFWILSGTQGTRAIHPAVLLNLMINFISSLAR